MMLHIIFLLPCFYNEKIFYVGFLKAPQELHKQPHAYFFTSKRKHFILIFKILILSENIAKSLTSFTLTDVFLISCL